VEAAPPRVAITLLDGDDLAPAQPGVAAQEHEQLDAGIELARRSDQPLVVRLLVELDGAERAVLPSLGLGAIPSLTSWRETAPVARVAHSPSTARRVSAPNARRGV